MSAGEDTRLTRELVIAKILGDQKFILASHEKPDGDAIGSMAAMQGLLTALGKDSVMFISPGDLPLPDEYTLFALAGMISEPPPDVRSRTVVFLDCGNVDRNPAGVLRDGPELLNIDHHHDNTRFGTINHVVPEASCTAEIVWDLMQALSFSPTPEIAEALYVGLITDTGRFMYENTTDGELSLISLDAADFAAAGAQESDSEGVIDHLRALRGTKVAVLVREVMRGERTGQRKVSLRATDGEVDVSVIARAQGGGGHTRAAGFSTSMELEQLIEFLRAEIGVQRNSLPGSQPAAPVA
jgi:phosphoesterase RecJ-like protein